jgi:hypothetical protein
MSVQDSIAINQDKFEVFIKKNELKPDVAQKLKTVLTTSEIVLLCDDSTSMTTEILEEDQDPFSPNKTTRWMELKKLAAEIIKAVTSINPNGLDIYFLNRPKICNVTDISGLQYVFSTNPSGGTPLTKSINKIYSDKKNIPQDKNLLILVITDGEPTDDTSNPRQNLFNTLVNKKNNVHVSFAECTSDEESMAYLDEWDNKIKNFDNTDDYREELKKVKKINGSQYKFDYCDYVIKIILATFYREYFNIDQQYSYQYNSNNCCIIL